MNVNKKLDRLKQWGKERMGSEAKTGTSDEFKALEVEMSLRHDGMDRLKKSADVYIKSISKREKYDEREQQLAVGYFGTTMISHGDDFEPESEYGQCLSMLGRANERIARTQEMYCANATSSWLESLERSAIQMREYNAARKRLESRRLAYDTAAAKMQRSKREDFKAEEELRSQKMKYEESNEDVYRRMLDIKEAEADSINDLTSFLEAELAYYDRCREVLMQLKREWPASTPPTRGSGTSSPANGLGRHNTRSRASSTNDRFNRMADDDEPEPPLPRPAISSSRSASGQNSPYRELPGFDLPTRPSARSISGASSSGLDGAAMAPPPRLPRGATEPVQLPSAARSGHGNLRIPRAQHDDDLDSNGSGTESSSYYNGDAGQHLHALRKQRSWTSSTTTTTTQNGGSNAATAATSEFSAAGLARKGPPPPPPPSRAKKPPPPPPMKRSALSSNEVPRY